MYLILQFNSLVKLIKLTNILSEGAPNIYVYHQFILCKCILSLSLWFNNATQQQHFQPLQFWLWLHFCKSKCLVFVCLKDLHMNWNDFQPIIIFHPVLTTRWFILLNLLMVRKEWKQCFLETISRTQNFNSKSLENQNLTWKLYLNWTSLLKFCLSKTKNINKNK